MNGRKEVADIVQNAFVNKVDMVGLNRLNYLCGAVFAEKAAQFMRENKIDSADDKGSGIGYTDNISGTAESCSN